MFRQKIAGWHVRCVIAINVYHDFMNHSGLSETAITGINPIILAVDGLCLTVSAIRFHLMRDIARERMGCHNSGADTCFDRLVSPQALKRQVCHMA
jgi:hypothetical protein